MEGRRQSHAGDVKEAGPPASPGRKVSAQTPKRQSSLAISSGPRLSVPSHAVTKKVLKQGNAGGCPPPKHQSPNLATFGNARFRVRRPKGSAAPAAESANPRSRNIPFLLFHPDRPPSHPAVFRRRAGGGTEGAPPPPRPQGRAGHGEPTPAQQRGGGVPYLGSGPAHPSLGRVLAPAARAPAARPLPPPPPRDVAGMQAAAAWASISRSQRRKSSAGLGHVPAPAPISALEFFSPFRPESGAGEGKEPTCWWSHRGQHRPQVWGPGDSHPPGAGAQPPRQERLGCAAPCRPLAANASVSRAAKGPAASRELQRLG